MDGQKRGVVIACFVVLEFHAFEAVQLVGGVLAERDQQRRAGESVELFFAG